MSIYIYSGADRIGILQNERSVQWVENYQNVDEAKIVCDATAENVNLLAIGHRLYNTKTATIADIIANDISEQNGKNELTVRAVGSCALLDRRIVMGTEVITNIEAGLRKCFTDNRRGLPLVLGAAQGFTETAQTEVTFLSLLKAFTTLCEQAGFGFRVAFDPDTTAETLQIYKGTDRTSGAEYNGYFGTELGNMLKLNLSVNQKDYKNVAIVAGEGEGAERVVVAVSLGNVQGSERRELYVNASGVKKNYQTATPTGGADALGNPEYTYTDGIYSGAEYAQVLTQKGVETLLENIRTVSVSAEVTQNPMEYGKDYFLGDLVPVKSSVYNLTLSARVLSVTRISESDGDKMLVALGNFNITEEGTIYG